MSKGWLLGIAIALTLIYAIACVSLDKAGFATPALLCGFPVWIVAGITAGMMLVGGSWWTPVSDPGAYGETPGWIFWFFGGFFFLALMLGIYYTEPVVCTGSDGDFCYEKQTLYEIKRHDGTTYNGYYRNTYVWSNWRVSRAADVASDAVIFSDYGGGGGSWISDMDLDDSEAAIFIVLLVIIVIIVIASAFVPNLWVLACGLCLVGFYLTILRIHRQEVLYGGLDLSKTKPDAKFKNDPLLADPPSGDMPDTEFTK